MKSNTTRRGVLKKSSAMGFGFTALSIPKGLKNLEKEINETPSIDSDKSWFRVYNNTQTKRVVNVRLSSVKTGAVSLSEGLETTGTNHPSIKGLDHAEKHSLVAADIVSPGKLNPGKHQLKVEYQGKTNSNDIYIDNKIILDGVEFVSYIRWDGEVTVNPMYSCGDSLE